MRSHRELEGLFEKEIWKALFEFQKDGAIADSVGPGKTYEALAVMKYFELKNV